jgi:hypothetical protein
MRRSVKSLAAVGALSIAVPLAGADARPTAQSAQSSQGVRGSFSLQQMFHTSSSQFGNLPGVRPWNGRSRSDSSFVYRGIPCTGQAPVNNIASNLPTYNGRILGSRSPASTRFHPFRFRVQRTRRGTEMLGQITMTVCQLRNGPTPNPDPVADPRKPKIRFSFRARFQRQNVEELRFDGTFRILGGTGRYDDLTGSGSISGYLFCFAPQGCNGTGRRFLDGQVSMQGRYADPTPELSAR